jgi:tetratricopeptide (TPR) repeat protein
MTFRAALVAAALLVPAPMLQAQDREQPSPTREARREATRLDGEARFRDARVIWQRLIDEAPDAAAKAAAQRRMAMSYGFEGDCTNAVRYHQMVIDYWKTRESAEPQNAFYQEGEMANESARVCIDAGDLATAERMYRLGYELGNREPEPRTHPQSLWDYRLAHALGRLAARRGDKAVAERQVAAARRILDGDRAMADSQARFFPYLAGYVALYTGDLAQAEEWLTRALEIRRNHNDPFMHCLLAMTYERLGQTSRARELYQRAYQLAEGGHNPPAAYARRVAGEKLRSD